MSRRKKLLSLPSVRMACIVKTTTDGRLDTFMPLAETKAHFEAGRMVLLEGQSGDKPEYQWKADSDNDIVGRFPTAENNHV